MPSFITDTIFIKNMLCSCCIRLITLDFNKAGITIDSIQLGKATIQYDSEKVSHELIKKILKSNDFDLISDRETMLVEQIKNSVIELVHYSNNVNSIIRKSDYIIEKMNMSYQTISKLFSRHEKITLEKFIIIHKIERTKELILCKEYTLSEIAYMMDFSSVQHLSNTFKKVTGISVTSYKKSGIIDKTPLNNIC
jgi:AraC family transcriptional regulator